MSEAYVLRARSAVRKRGVFVKICRAEDCAFYCVKNEESHRRQRDEVRLSLPVEAAKTALPNRNVSKIRAQPADCR
jgi:hypothetical protein